MDLVSHDDATLVQAAAEGSAAARGELFRRHFRPVWQRAYAVTGRRSLADDVTQDSFERAFRGLPRLEDPASFPGWILRIAVNRAIDLLRSERRLVALEEAGEVAAWDAERGGDAALQAAVAALAPERRAVLVLRYWLDLPPGEIARILEIPAGTVHSRLARALAELRDALEEGDHV